MTTMVQRSTAYHCAMLRNVGTGPQGMVGERGGGGGWSGGRGLVAGERRPHQSGHFVAQWCPD